MFQRFADSAGGRPIKVVDIGCAHAGLFEVLNARFAVEYIGIEIHEPYYRAAHERYGRLPNFRVILGDAQSELGKLGEVDIVVALEALEHIPEHAVVRIIEQVAVARPHLFVRSVPVEIGPAIWLKNVGSLLMGYNRHREYSWNETFWAGLGKLDKLPPHGVGHKGFDWRWLAQTVRHSHRITGMQTFPFDGLPASVSTSVFFIAEPRRNAGDQAGPRPAGNAPQPARPAQ